MISSPELLREMQAAVRALQESIRARIDEQPDVAAHLESEHVKAKSAGRTAMALRDWREGEITQAAVAWVLGCVFVRFLEDNRLIDEPLLAASGPRRSEAVAAYSEYVSEHPAHTDREFLEHCFRAAARFPAVRPVFDERHNPLWRLGPTADGATELLARFTRRDGETGELALDFEDPQLSTRFLGDLYQELSEDAKKRYALRQTPAFVEEFILDRTLEPALEEFGLEGFRLIDPTCGSGHFLISAFERLFARWSEREPGTEPGVLVGYALGSVYGIDLNPFATAIAEFRLVIAALQAAGISRLAEAPPWTLNLATGDSLLHGPLPETADGTLFDDRRMRQGIAHVYETEDAPKLQAMLGKGFHAVVGNPPYIAVQDSALRDAYRERYTSCKGKYVLVVPFMERFFELARMVDSDGTARSGFVGKITGNNFMKREFGQKLVEEFLPSVDLQTVIDASGVYIPGHGTPTVILFGRTRSPVTSTLRVLDGIRGEPSQPQQPAEGVVWRSIVDLVDLPGEENDFIRASDIARSEILTHPMTLGVGRELKLRLEANRPTVDEFSASIGFASFTGMDDGFVLDPATAKRLRLHGVGKPFVIGDAVRDWALKQETYAVAPYDDSFDPIPLDLASSWARLLWPNRTVALNTVSFGNKTRRELGDDWWTWYRWVASKYRTPLSITWGEVATHNHFVLDRGGKVFKQTAPVIKLAADATEDDHLALLGVLNSSVACFWLKQVCQNKGSTVDNRGARQRTAPFEDFFQIASTKVKACPLPSDMNRELASELDKLAVARSTTIRDALADRVLSGPRSLAQAHEVDALARARMIFLQEELDWRTYAAYGLLEPGADGVLAPDEVITDPSFGIAFGERAFEFTLARLSDSDSESTTWFARHKAEPKPEPPAAWPEPYRRVVSSRIQAIARNPAIAAIERPEYKRRWNEEPWEERVEHEVIDTVLDAIEQPALWSGNRLRSAAELTDVVVREQPRVGEALELLMGPKDASRAAVVDRLVRGAAVPYLAAQRLTESGLRKRATWEEVWELQRAEDRGEPVGEIPTPPKYKKEDMRAGVWTHRGKLDVPKERFVLAPGAERATDPSALIGWAGWNHRDLAVALATHVAELRESEAAGADRLTPLLAGILEQLPWIAQWHPEPDPTYGPMADFFRGFLDNELALLGLSDDDLRAWRPAPTTRGRKKATA